MKKLIENLIALNIWNDIDIVCAQELRNLTIRNFEIQSKNESDELKKLNKNSALLENIFDFLYIITLVLSNSSRAGHVCLKPHDAKDYLVKQITTGYVKLQNKSFVTDRSTLDYFDTIIDYQSVKLSDSALLKTLDAIDRRTEEYLSAKLCDAQIWQIFDELEKGNLSEYIKAMSYLNVLQNIRDDCELVEDNSNVLKFQAPIIFNKNRFYFARSFYSEYKIAEVFKQGKYSQLFKQQPTEQLAELIKEDKAFPDISHILNNDPQFEYEIVKKNLLILKELINIFFKNNDIDSVDWQKNAVCNSLFHQVSVITGGPGTGKTTSVAKLISIILLLTPNIRITLTAPTGKASDRLLKSFLASVEYTILPILTNNFEKTDNVVEKLKMISSATIHSLIQNTPGENTAKYNSKRTLPYDLIVVDEASMIDISLMEKLFAAIDLQKTKIIFLGDKDQLASVNPGAILADICSVFNSDFKEKDLANGNDAITYKQDLELLKFLTDTTEDQLVESFRTFRPQSKDGVFVAPAISTLLKSHRFVSRVGIGHLATLINYSQQKELMDFLKEAKKTDISKCDKSNLKFDENGKVENKYVDYYEVKGLGRDDLDKAHVNIRLDTSFKENNVGLANTRRYNYFDYMNFVLSFNAMNEAPEDNMSEQSSDNYKKFGEENIKKTFSLFNKYRILTLTNHGVLGVGSINHNLLEQGLKVVKESEKFKKFLDENPGFFDMYWFPGLPYIVTENDKNLNLSNGDIGICHFDIENPLSKKVWFENGLSYPISLLAKIQPAFALTIHKSQGSEFDHTAVVISSNVSRLISKELFYTAVTRAKTQLTIYGDLDTLTNGKILQSTDRFTGLKERLYENYSKRSS